MPRYGKKVTRLMTYEEFTQTIIDKQKEIMGMPTMHRALLTVLFFTGCRVSEAIALTSQDINCTKDTVFIQIKRLKGSKQTDPIELPKTNILEWLCKQEGNIFPNVSRYAAYRIVKRVFPDLYPHYFRMNRITLISHEFSDATVYHLFGICAGSIDHYRAKVDIKGVGESLKEEIKKGQHS